MTHAERFAELASLLGEWQPVWQPSPFQSMTPPWSTSHIALYHAVQQLDEASVARLRDVDPYSSHNASGGGALHTHPLAEHLPLARLAELCALPALTASAAALPASWAQHVGGRKWQQIEAFVPQVSVNANSALVEWCAGKGHLSRALSRLHERPVTALEWQPELCREGLQLASQQNAPVTFIEQDVMAASAGQQLNADSQVAALHACGDLHVRLLELAVKSGAALTLAPCCYQRTAAPHYRPLSVLGREQAALWGLDLERETLALAVQETVTAPRTVRRQRRANAAWRLGFDLLQRELRGCDDYLPVPSLAYGRMPKTFADFCAWAAARKGLILPDGIDWQHRETLGWQRQAEVERLELVRQLFRRPLELWLVLDRVLMLEEAGFKVVLGTFCQRHLTPRNLLIQATRLSGG